MRIRVDAVYERGVLRLKEPIALAEGSKVEVVIISRDLAVHDSNPAELLAAIAALPQESGTRAKAGRDHDSVIYDEE